MKIIKYCQAVVPFILALSIIVTLCGSVDVASGSPQAASDGHRTGTTTNTVSFSATTPMILYARPGPVGSGDCSSWANACTLQSALSISANGTEIWVMQGTHRPGAIGPRIATFQLKNSVGLYGGFAGAETTRAQRDPTTNVTILSGDMNGNDNSNVRYDEPTRSENSYHVVTGSGTDSTAVLDGFTVTGGNANAADGSPLDLGGGMENTSGSPTVANVIFSNNSAYRAGGAISNTNGSNPTLVNVIIQNNSSLILGGGIYNLHSSPMLTNVTIYNNSNSGTGGGMHNYASNPTLSKVTFVNNSAAMGGGMYNMTSSNPTLTNVTFAGNSTPTSGSGGGMLNTSSSSPLLTNVTFVGNSATYGGGMYNDSDAHPAIRNSIFWGNAPNNIVDVGGNTTIRDSVVEGGCPTLALNCTNIITANPALGALGNYGGGTQTIPLLPGSSAINAGNATYCPSQDQRGANRVGTCDMGVFEAQGFTLIITGGSGQTAAVNASFAAPLQVSITANHTGDPVNGGVVTFTAPTSGASVTAASQSITISGGGASANETANSVAGSYQVSAGASGANSVNFDLTNEKMSTTVQLTSSPNPSKASQSVVFTATVTAALGVPTGTVTFYDGAAVIGTSSVNASGAASLNITTLSGGTHQITAHYSGDTNFANSTSSICVHTVWIPMYIPIIIK